MKPEPPSKIKYFLIILAILFLAWLFTRKNTIEYSPISFISPAYAESLFNPNILITLNLNITSDLYLTGNLIPETTQTPPKSTHNGELGDIKAYAREKVIETWGAGEWEAFNQLEINEAGWIVGRMNEQGSGACGLGQALPCEKMPPGCLHNGECELDWMISYILQRYKTPTQALYFWNHEAPKYNGRNWY
jgi:hypothetical protein